MEKVKNQTEAMIALAGARPGDLQDLWHYAVLIVDRGRSTFDGDSAFPAGIIGQVRAYENLIRKLGDVTAENDNEVDWLTLDGWRCPATYEQMIDNAAMALKAINKAAECLGIEARTGERGEA